MMSVCIRAESGVVQLELGLLIKKKKKQKLLFGLLNHNRVPIHRVWAVFSDSSAKWARPQPM